eukprot:2218223-Karenia_brevis.AAC.1
MLGTFCRPCVVSAYFRALWNGWPTTARLRSIATVAAVKSCVLGCTGCEDRLEHYLICDKVWQVLQRRPPSGLGLRREKRGLQYMLMAEKGMEDEEKMGVAIACYAIARTVQTMSNNGPIGDYRALLKLFLQEGLRGSRARACIKKWSEKVG